MKDHDYPYNINIACEECGSTDVMRDAVARWCVESQRWELADVHDQGYCGPCDGEARLTEVRLPDAEPAQKPDAVVNPCGICGRSLHDGPGLTMKMGGGVHHIDCIARACDAHADLRAACSVAIRAMGDHLDFADLGVSRKFGPVYDQILSAIAKARNEVRP